MKEYVSLRDANQHLSKYIDSVVEGHEVIITRRGKPVARLISLSEDKVLTEEQALARERMLKRMQRGCHLGGQPVIRKDIYER